jgi:curved DNA-binding protein
VAYAGGVQKIGVDGRTLEVKIPVGIRPGQVIRLAGQGASHGNGKRSDLLLEIDYRPHGEFEVDGRNILFTLPLAPWEAALGTRVSVPTLGGRVRPARAARIRTPGASCACADAACRQAGCGRPDRRDRE